MYLTLVAAWLIWLNMICNTDPRRRKKDSSNLIKGISKMKHRQSIFIFIIVVYCFISSMNEVLGRPKYNMIEMRAIDNGQ